MIEYDKVYITSSMFPRTRYQGSKLKLAEWVYTNMENTLSSSNFQCVLDLFGGTGTMSLKFQHHGKAVVYNDVMRFNAYASHAVLLPSPSNVCDDDIDSLFIKQDDRVYLTTVVDVFDGVFYTKEENEQIDIAAQNLLNMEQLDKKYVLTYLFMQSCLIKRPYNLFHRNNLNMRTRDVQRSFGNKKSWETPFLSHMKRFLHELNEVWASKPMTTLRPIILNMALDDMDETFVRDQLDAVDTVYMDPPYFKKNCANRDYIDYYHFLEGLVRYDTWQDRIDMSRPQKCFKSEYEKRYVIASPTEMFEKCIQLFKHKNIVISYRKDGFPTIDWIEEQLRKYKENVVIRCSDYQYALSSKVTEEVLIIAF